MGSRATIPASSWRLFRYVLRYKNSPFGVEKSWPFKIDAELEEIGANVVSLLHSVSPEANLLYKVSQIKYILNKSKYILEHFSTFFCTFRIQLRHLIQDEVPCSLSKIVELQIDQ